MKINRRILTCAVLSVLAGSVASADTIVATTSFSANAVNLSSPGSETVTLSQFNADAINGQIQAGCAAGFTCSPLTLTDIAFTINANILGTVNFINDLSTDQTIQPSLTLPHIVASAYADVLIKDPNGVEVAEAIPTFSVTNSVLVPANGSVLKSGPGNDAETGDVNALTGAATTSTGFSGTLTEAQILSTYIGTGVIDFDFGLTGGVTLPGRFPNGTNVNSNTETLLNTSTLGVTYTYQYAETQTLAAAPEPASMALMGAAFIGLGLLGKRLRKN